MKDELGRLQDSIKGKIKALLGRSPSMLFVLFCLDGEEVGYIVDGELALLPVALGNFLGSRLEVEAYESFFGVMEIEMAIQRGEVAIDEDGNLYEGLADAADEEYRHVLNVLRGVGDEDKPLDEAVLQHGGPVDATDSGDDKDLPEQPEEDHEEDIAGVEGDV